MGQVIAFPFAPPYPDLAADLDTADSVLLTAIRWWIGSYRASDDPLLRLCQGLETSGAQDAAFSIDGLMTGVAHAVTRPPDINCPLCPHLSLDEKHLPRAASLAQAGKSHMAEKVLRTTLLSAQSAEFAVDPLRGLAELFTRARLVLSCRPPATERQATTDNRETWSPPHTLN